MWPYKQDVKRCIAGIAFHVFVNFSESPVPKKLSKFPQVQKNSTIFGRVDLAYKETISKWHTNKASVSSGSRSARANNMSQSTQNGSSKSKQAGDLPRTSPTVVSLPTFSSDIAKCLVVARKRVRKQLQTRVVTKRGGAGEQELDAELLRERKRACQVASGAAQLVELFRLLDAFGMQRSRVQKNLHLGMAGSVLQRIFHQESDAEMKVCMLQQHIKSAKQQFMAITPRRFGKTTAVAMFVAAFALAVPGTTTAIFSTGRRASNLLLQQVKSLLLCIPGAESKIVRCLVPSPPLCPH